MRNILGVLKNQLYSVKDYLPDSWKKSILPLGLGVIVGVTGTSYAVTPRDEKPPYIQMYVNHSDHWTEDDDIRFTIQAIDDKGVEEVYILVNNQKIPFRNVYRKKDARLAHFHDFPADSEESEWTTNFRLPPNDYKFDIIVRDKCNETRFESKYGKKEFTVHPRDKNKKPKYDPSYRIFEV